MNSKTIAFFEELKTDLQRGAQEKGHPFRYVVLATVGLEKVARQRTVVLRKVHNELDLVFYTDKRSKKLLHIKENNRVSLLFYHPKKMLQIRMEGLARITTDKTILKKQWDTIKSEYRKDYKTSSAPGSRISNQDSVEYLDTKNHFCIVEVEAFKIEYLKLKRPNHLRVQFSKIDTSWQSEFLVP